MKATGKTVLSFFIGFMVITALITMPVQAAGGHQGLKPIMKPSIPLCTGYPTPPPTYTPTPTPQPTSTPVAEHLSTNLCDDDSYVSAHSPNTNYGDSQFLSMRDTEYYVYLRFILDELENNASIVHTYLRLTPFEIPPVSSTVRIFTTSSEWTEDTITYNNRPSPQAQVGSLYVWTSTNPIEIDITEVIQEAYRQNLSEVNLIASYDSSYFDLNVESQETARPPLLKIFYNTQAAPTPTPEPTAGPGKLTTDITLNKDLFQAGDDFILTARFGNKQPYSVNSSLWVVLDVGDSMWFWPEWGETPSFMNATFIPGEEKVITPLQFTWPQGAGSATGVKFWSAILDEAHKDIAIDNVTFGWY